MKANDEQLMLDMAALVRRTAWRLSTQGPAAARRAAALHRSWDAVARKLRAAWKGDDDERAG